jgi:hypothetical protein
MFVLVTIGLGGTLLVVSQPRRMRVASVGDVAGV